MRRTLLRGSLGIAISAVALALVVSRVDLVAVGQVLGRASPVYVALVVSATCVDLACRTVRWQVLLAPIRRVAFLPTLGYLLVGYLGNNLLPARLGELVRSHYVGDREGFSRAKALGTIVVERVVDVAVLVAIASGAILVLQVRGVVASAPACRAGRSHQQTRDSFAATWHRQVPPEIAEAGGGPGIHNPERLVGLNRWHAGRGGPVP